jgi:hypothetical protein
VKTFSVEARKKVELGVPLEVPFKVSSTPAAAAVHLDSETAAALGQTPYAGGIPVGKRTVYVKLAGYKTFKQIVEVTKSAVEINAELPLGIKVASTPAGASVELDGKALPGVTPIEESATPGKHQVVVKLEGYKPFSTDVEVAPGKENTVSATLSGGLLTMRADVDGAKVTVGSHELGGSPLEKGSVPLGKQTVTVSHPDRRPWSGAVDFEENQTVHAKVRLGRSMAPVWVGIGVAAAGLALGVAGTVITKNARDDAVVNGKSVCNDWDDPKDLDKCNIPTMSYVGGIGYGMLGAGAAFSLFYYLFGARSTATIEKLPATTTAKRPPAPVAVQPNGSVKF